MNKHNCFFCGTNAGYFPVHGILVCAHCKLGIPTEETDDQDLFDEDVDFIPEARFVVADLLLLNS